MPLVYAIASCVLCRVEGKSFPRLLQDLLNQDIKVAPCSAFLTSDFRLFAYFSRLILAPRLGDVTFLRIRL